MHAFLVWSKRDLIGLFPVRDAGHSTGRPQTSGGSDRRLARAHGPANAATQSCPAANADGRRRLFRRIGARAGSSPRAPRRSQNELARAFRTRGTATLTILPDPSAPNIARSCPAADGNLPRSAWSPMRRRRRSITCSHPSMSSLYWKRAAGRIDDQTIATTIALRSGGAMFSWKMAYDESFGRYSPGGQLLLDLSEAALPTKPSRVSIHAWHRTTYDQSSLVRPPRSRGPPAERWRRRDRLHRRPHSGDARSRRHRQREGLAQPVRR
jgi:hypothetical protein